MSRRIAVLTTFEGDLPFAARHPDDGAKVRAGLQPWRPAWQFDTFRVSGGHWPADDAAYDGAVVTGSPASVNDGSAWIERLKALLRARQARGQATVGLCFGHQALAAALGGRVERSADGLRVGTVDLAIERPQPWMQPPRGSLTLYAAHDEQVTVLPDGAVRLGGDAACPVGAFVAGGRALGLQFHPEFDRAFMADVLDAFAGKMPASAAERGRAQIAGPVDSAIAMQWIAAFLDQAFAA